MPSEPPRPPPPKVISYAPAGLLEGRVRVEVVARRLHESGSDFPLLRREDLPEEVLVPGG